MQYALLLATLLAAFTRDPNPPLRAVALADKPPMGWNSWNKFGCKIDEQLIRQTADAMVSSGMRAAGYEYVNIDDCWMAKDRDGEGNLQADPVRFSHGIKALADYVHAQGLKLGIYSSAGTMTCQGLPASLDHEVADAKKFAEWGVDYLKYDNCNSQKRPAIERYTAMGNALKATGRPMIFSLCEWGENKSWEWGKSVGGMLWRTTGDIEDSWKSMLANLDQQVPLVKYSGPGGWNDPDMLEVGNGHMTFTEYVTHFSLWAILNAPLIAGNDLRTMSDTTRAILTNKDVIAVDQDWGGEQGSLVRTEGNTQVWVKPMRAGSKAVLLLNRGPTPTSISIQLADLDFKPSSKYTALDVWAHTVQQLDQVLQSGVPAHGAAMFIVKGGR
jgi:alpha-galactosidase